MKRFFLLITFINFTFNVFAINSNISNDELVGYALSTKYNAFARISGTITTDHAELTLFTSVYPHSISKPVQTSVSANIHLNETVCVTGIQHIPNKGDAKIFVKNCKVEIINNLQVLHGMYWTESSTGGSQGITKPDHGLISVNY